MTQLTENFYACIAGYLREEYGRDVSTVVNVEETTESGGYCETCWYEETVLYIEYRDSNGGLQDTTIYESFATLLRSLTHD